MDLGWWPENSIPKPAFNAFTLLHRLGDVRVDSDSASVVVTRTKNGGVVLAVWGKIVAPEQKPVGNDVVQLEFTGLTGKHSARVTIVDDEHGSPLPAYEKMGSPHFLTQPQIAQLRAAAEMPAAKTMPISGNTLKLTLSGHALALVEIAP